MNQPPTQQAVRKADPQVVAAIDALTPEDVQRLENYARLKMSRLAGTVRVHEWKDLLQQAVFKTLYGDRPWSPDAKDKSGNEVTFLQHLFGCMRSIAHGWLEKEGRYTSLSSQEISATYPDAELEARMRVEELRDAFEKKYDTTAIVVLHTIEEGYSPKEAQEKFDLHPDGYWAARKRIGRRVQSLLRSSEDKQR